MNIEEKKAEEYTIGNITSSSEKNKKYIKKVLEANGKIPELCKKEQIIYMEKKLDESLGEIAQLSDTLTIEQYELEQIEKERVSVKKGDRWMKGFIEQVIEIKKELIGEYKRLLDFNKYLKDELSRKEIFRVKRKLEKELKIIKDRVEDNAKCSSNYVKRFSKKKE